MNQELRIIVEQMEEWSKKYHLEMTPNFKGLVSRISEKEEKSRLDRIQHMYDYEYDEYGRKKKYNLANEYEMRDAKKVVVKQDRLCFLCGQTINKGESAITTRKKIQGKYERFWYHTTCTEKRVKAIEDIFNDMLDNLDPEWDDGCSSNGY